MIENNLDTNINKLFENYAEEPSSSCWNAVSSKLDVLLPATVASTSAAASGFASFSKFFASVVGKTIALITGLAVIGTTIYAFWPENVQKTTSAPNIIVKNEQTPETQITKPTENTKTVAVLSEKQEIPALPTNANSSSANVDKDNTEETTSISNKPKTDHFSPALTSRPVSVAHSFVDNNNGLTSDQEGDYEEVPTIEKADPITEKSVSSVHSNVEMNLVFPNVFTPNGDGFNDYFVIKNLESLAQQKLVVINAKGQKVFEANNYQNNWDALNIPDGAYFYVLETKENGKVQTYYGSLQIVR